MKDRVIVRKRYDSEGRVINVKSSDGFEKWFEYHANGMLFRYRDNKGTVKEYDEDGLLFSYEDNNIYAEVSHTDHEIDEFAYLSVYRKEDGKLIPICDDPVKDIE